VQSGRFAGIAKRDIQAGGQRNAATHATMVKTQFWLHPSARVDHFTRQAGQMPGHGRNLDPIKTERGGTYAQERAEKK